MGNDRYLSNRMRGAVTSRGKNTPSATKDVALGSLLVIEALPASLKSWRAKLTVIDLHAHQWRSLLPSLSYPREARSPITPRPKAAVNTMIPPTIVRLLGISPAPHQAHMGASTVSINANKATSATGT